jgi:hypothetical protein
MAGRGRHALFPIATMGFGLDSVDSHIEDIAGAADALALHAERRSQRNRSTQTQMRVALLCERIWEQNAAKPLRWRVIPQTCQTAIWL